MESGNIVVRRQFYMEGNLPRKQEGSLSHFPVSRGVNGTAIMGCDVTCRLVEDGWDHIWQVASDEPAASKCLVAGQLACDVTFGTAHAAMDLYGPIRMTSMNTPGCAPLNDESGNLVDLNVKNMGCNSHFKD